MKNKNLLYTSCWNSFFLLWLINISAAADSSLETDTDETHLKQAHTKTLLKLSLEELQTIIVMTPSKSEEQAAVAPSIVTVITRQEIERFGANSLPEVLERVVGVYQPLVYSFPNNLTAIRGDIVSDIETHVLLLLNGRPFKDGLIGGINYSIYNAFPLSAIKQIEMVRGPGSVLYGTNAFSGVINIITKDPTDTKDGAVEGEVTVTAGSLGTRRTDAHIAHKTGDFSIAGSLRYFQEDGWVLDAIDETNTSGSQMMNEHNVGAHVQANYKNLNVNLGFFDSREGFLGSVPIWEWGAEQLKASRYFADIGYRHDFSEQWQLQTNLTYNGLRTDYHSSESFVNDSFNDVLLESTLSWQKGNFSWLGGGTIYRTEGNTLITSRTTAEEIYLLAPYDEIWYTLYTQASYQLSNNIRLIGGGQVVKPADLDWSFVPRLGLTYQFSENLGFKALFSEAYRGAFEFENAIDSEPFIKGNPNLSPEQVKTYDLQVFYQNNFLKGSLTYFNSQQKNLIIQNFDPVTGTASFMNKSELHLRGLELETTYNPFEDLLLLASVSYQENSQNNIDNFTTVPNWMVKIGISYDFTPSFNMGLYNNYYSAAGDVNVRFGNTKYYNPEADAFHLMTLNLNLDVGQWLSMPSGNRLSVNGYIYNVLDEAVYSPEFIRGELNTLPARQGRTYYLGMKYAF